MHSNSPTWQKSSRSTGSSNCVEVADDTPVAVLVRDSKDQAGPVLTFSPSAWLAFVARVPHTGP